MSGSCVARKDQNCGNCNARRETRCFLNPPQPVAKTSVLSSARRAINEQMPMRSQRTIESAWEQPPIELNGWCEQWRISDELFEKIITGTTKNRR